MSVYADPMFPWPPTKKWPYPEACHLIADSKEELIEFAVKLGLRPDWIQTAETKPKDKYRIPHFDLTRNKRKLAVKAGTIEINTREMARKIKFHRHKIRGKEKTK